jgi:Holliday junction resolvase
MSIAVRIHEIDVLIASALWLWERRIIPVQFSIATGKGLDAESHRRRLVAALDKAGVPATIREFAATGPDVIGFSQNEFWQVECKGVSGGTKQTRRNDFDRALASVVSYYIEDLSEWPEGIRGAKPCLALALPEIPDYLSELTRRVGSPLRRKLDL